jgi:predicted Rossmann-fold nucleotide-binding protein
LYLIQSSDAVITIGGRFGSLHEFTSALEAHKPCGILLGSGGTADIIPSLMQQLEPPEGDLVVYDDDPERLVAKIIAILDKKYADIHDDLTTHDQKWYLETHSKGKGHAG